MGHSSKHLSDEDILLLLDRELSHAQSDAMHQHLEDCLECRTRSAEKQRALAELDDLFTTQAGEPIPSSTARSRLALQLSRHAEPVPTRYPWRTMAASFLLAAAGLGLYVGLRGHERTTYVMAAGNVPNLSLTPGAIREVTLNEICSTADDDDDLDPVLPSSIQNAVFKEYGIAAQGTEQNYQIDYLVNPQLGGTNDIRNLWPQAYHSGVWNAHAKDQLEERLHQMVCNRTIDLATAQHEITRDWIAAYKKYMQQPTPRT